MPLKEVFALHMSKYVSRYIQLVQPSVPKTGECLIS